MLKRINPYIYIFLFISSYIPLYSQDNLNGYLKQAAENNPGLKASFADYQAAMEKVPQVGGLPDPQLTFGFFIRPMEFLMGNQRAELSLMQMFPWFGMLGAAKDEASLMAKAQYESFQEAKNQLFYDVKQTWYSLYRLNQEIKITEENLEILRSMERTAIIRYQGGGGSGSGKSGRPMPSPGSSGNGSQGSGLDGMSGGNTSGNSKRSTSSDMAMGGAAMSGRTPGMVDVLRVQMEIKELESQLAMLRDSRKPLVSRFNQLLNRPLNETVSVADTLLARNISADSAYWLESLRKNNPMVVMLEAEQESSQAKERMARLEGRPMFGAGLNYMIFSPRSGDLGHGVPVSDMNGNNMIMPMVTVTLPIYRKKYKAAVKEASLQKQATLERKEHTINLLTVQWDETIRDYKDATRRTALYQAQKQLAQQSVDILLTAYTNEGYDFEEVLRAQQQLLDYQLRLLNAVVDQNTLVAMLEMLAATEINR